MKVMGATGVKKRLALCAYGITPKGAESYTVSARRYPKAKRRGRPSCGTSITGDWKARDFGW